MRENLPNEFSSERYDEYALALDHYDRMLIARLLQVRRARPEARRLVDMCTGTARVLARIANVADLAELELVGFDYFDDMVAQARQTVSSLGLEDRIRIVHADVHAMPFPDGYADLMIGRSIIHHWADPVAAFREIGRVLAPGGAAIIHEPRRDPSPEAHRAFEAVRSQVGIPPTDLEEKFTAPEVEEQLQQAGVASYARVIPGPSGDWAMGFEVRFEKPATTGICAA